MEDNCKNIAQEDANVKERGRMQNPLPRPSLELINMSQQSIVQDEEREADEARSDGPE